MPEVNQYTWNHRELLEVLARAASLTEGRWMLMIQFNMTPGNFGPSEKDLLPGMLVGVARIGLQRADINSPEALVLDAADIRPEVEKREAARGKKRTIAAPAQS